MLSLFWKGSKLGGAVYSGDTSEVVKDNLHAYAKINNFPASKVFILADVPDMAPHFNLTSSFITQIGPR